MISSILTMRTANGCTAPTAWRPWARPRRLLLLQRRRKQRRPARRRGTTAVGFCARDPETVVWILRAIFSGSRTRLKRTHDRIIMTSNKTLGTTILNMRLIQCRRRRRRRPCESPSTHVAATTLFYNTIQLQYDDRRRIPTTTTTTAPTTPLQNPVV